MPNPSQVHCGYISVETTAIRKILQMIDGASVDFYNRRYRTECRVVDFRPSDIRDFARRIDGDTEACGVDIGASMDTESGHAKPPPEWYWCFELDVMGKEDDKLLTIHVDDSGGRYLLTPEPCEYVIPPYFYIIVLTAIHQFPRRRKSLQIRPTPRGALPPLGKS